MGLTVEYIEEFGRDELDTESGSLFAVPLESRLSVFFIANASFLYTPTSVTLSTTGGSGFIFSGQFDVESISTSDDLSEFSGLGGTVSTLIDLSEEDGDIFQRYKITFDEAIGVNELVFGSTWSTLLDGDDVVIGGGGADYLFSYNGNDVLHASLSNDLLDGGAGVDRVIYASPKSTIQRIENDFSVDGDTLRNIERLEFSDVKIAFDIAGSAGQTAKTLAAVLGADGLSNTEYVGIGLQLFDSGQSLASVCELALTAVGATSHADIVTTLYTNLYGEDPSDEQLQTYVELLDDGVFTKGSLAAAAAELTDDLGVIDLVGLAETGIEYV